MDNMEKKYRITIEEKEGRKWKPCEGMKKLETAGFVMLGVIDREMAGKMKSCAAMGHVSREEIFLMLMQNQVLRECCLSVARLVRNIEMETGVNEEGNEQVIFRTLPEEIDAEALLKKGKKD